MGSWTFHYGQLELPYLRDEEAQQLRNLLETMLQPGRTGGGAIEQMDRQTGERLVLFISPGIPMWLEHTAND